MLQKNMSHTDATLWLFYTSGRSYKVEQYLPCLWREENHTTRKRKVLYVSQLYIDCNRKLASQFEDKFNALLSQKSGKDYKKSK